MPLDEAGTPRACVIGWPIKHSRSPLIHRHWLTTYGIKGSYDRLAVPPESLPNFLKTIGTAGLRGANVTVPHKESAFKLCGHLTPAAKAIGAVNTLWWDDGRLCGDNTDALGFIASLDEEARNWRDRTRLALVLGAGGAARAIIYALTSAGVDRIVIANRSAPRAASLAAEFAPLVCAMSWNEISGVLGQADLVVNATSLGMEGQDPLNIDVASLKDSAVVADIVYTPLATPLVAAARHRGLVGVAGLGMLLHQATAGFERWFGVRPEVTPELRALIEADIVPLTRKPT